MKRDASHDSARSHVTGRSEYIDDRPPVRGEVYVEVCWSPHARARIKRLHTLAATKAPGVVAVFTADDFHENLWGTVFQDQPLLAHEEVNYCGEPYALVVADSPTAARLARDLVKVDWEILNPILSIQEARSRKSFIGFERTIARGDAESALLSAPHRLEGTIVIRGAEHFYLESQAAAAIPREDGVIEVHSSAQHPSEVQHVVAHALGIDYSRVICVVKRMGGAFGGKESQAAPFAAYAALAAQKLGRPARIALTKDDDMVITGKRNPFENHWKVGFDQKGRILALDVNLFSDGGACADLSTAIMERAMLHTDNAYFIPDFQVRGQVCRTNFHPHTAFRGFGGPKGVATIERIVEEIAHFLKMDPLDVRRINCYEGPDHDITPYGQKVENNLLPELFSRLEKSCAYRARRREIETHNRKSQATRRGLSLTPVKFGISFTTRYLNQANALVVIHRDGSLQVSTGATEMGQGVNTRIGKIVADVFGLPAVSVRLMPTSTEKNANTSPTAASSGTDLNGAAAEVASFRIRHRLGHIALRLMQLPSERWAAKTAGLGTESEAVIPAEEPAVDFCNGYVVDRADPKRKVSFQDVVNEAYLNRVSLSEYAHYKFPHLTFNKLTGQGRAFLYFTQGAACSEVEIDSHTGETKVRRVDILMDLGRPVNESLDRGQVAGAFVQGMGWVTTEKLHYSEGGLLLSHAPSTYKIPNIQDTPREFNIDLLDNPHNSVNVRGTKAVGEPPLLLAISVWTAIHDALRGLPSWKEKLPELELPATQEEVFRAIDPERFEEWR